MATPDMNDLKRRMEGALSALHKEFGGLRTGRASASLLEPLVVEAYGNPMPITQLGTINVPEPRMLSVQVWDKANVKAVEKAVRDSGLGLNPVVEGQVLRIPIPQLTEERRNELTKVAAKYAEQAKVAVRNVRRDGMDLLKHMEKDGELSKDEHHNWSQKIQTLTDEYIQKIDEGLDTKTKEISHI
ncbi:MAG: ribosome recycling factor [Alphaproteobacteria bacterium]|nr:ribosome recycling factor [Alphaproteobacteria bacterium]